MFENIVYAMGSAPGQGGQQAGVGGMLTSFLPLVIIMFIFYFLLIRPQQKQQKTHKEMLSKLKKGDKVKDKEKYYPELIENFYRYLQQNHNKLLRDYDRENFIKPVQDEEATSA